MSRYDLQAQLRDLKSECAWLKEVNSQSLQCALLNLDSAYSLFFKGVGGFPTFKKKQGRQSFQCPQNVTVDFKAGTIDLPKFKQPIKAVLHRTFTGTTKTVTISRTPLHHECGNINHGLTLADREWVCPSCGGLVSRDINAAKNILHFGLLKDSAMERRVGPVESPTLVGTLKQEKLKRAMPDL